MALTPWIGGKIMPTLWKADRERMAAELERGELDEASTLRLMNDALAVGDWRTVDRIIAASGHVPEDALRNRKARRAAETFNGGPVHHAPPDVGAIMAYEAGELDADGERHLFQRLVDSGLAWKLQGHYGRTAAAMIKAGEITAPTR
jgi:hypothetical protein